MAAQFQFVMRSGPTVGKVTPLTTQEVTIGRDVSNSFTINDAEVSRKHARMELRGSAYVIQDLGSTNGTFVNGKRISAMQVLNAGDLVSFGEGIVLVYEGVVDVNATVLSSKPVLQPSATTTAAASAPPPVSKPTPAAKPVSTPAPAPTPAPAAAPAPAPAPASAPAPVYSGRVPASPATPAPVPSGPVPMPPDAAPPKKKFPIWVLIIILLVVVICGCVGFFVIVDRLSLWCKVVPFLVPILGGTC